MFKSLRDRLKGVADQLEDELEAQLEAQLDAELEAELAPTEPVPAEPEAPAEAPVENEAPVPDEAPVEPEVPAKPTPEAPAEPGPAEQVAEAAVEAVAEPTAEPTATPTVETPPRAASPPKITGRKMLDEAEVEARLARELGEAVEVQKEVESAVEPASARYTINEDVLADILWELEIGLLESDVALPVIEAIKDSVQEQLLSMQVGGKNAHEVVEKVLRAAIRRVLNVNALDFDAYVKERIGPDKKPLVIMFVGVNGTGKTTSIARIGYRLQQQGVSSVMAAGDTFRAGAIAQLSQHGDTLGIKVVKHTDGADPAAVAYDAIEHAKARHKDVVLLDTAGRMQTNTNLMDEMDKIRRVANPDLVVFVGDSLAGNDAVEQARRFDEVVDIDGAILTKTDVDAKGGAALSVAYTINKPLLFIGVGQDYPDLEPFSADVMVDRLFGED